MPRNLGGDEDWSQLPDRDIDKFGRRITLSAGAGVSIKLRDLGFWDIAVLLEYNSTTSHPKKGVSVRL